MTDLEPGWTRRELTADERGELRAASARLRRFPPALGVLTAIVLFLLGRAVLAGGRTGSMVLLALFAVVVVATSWTRYRRARTLATELLADAEAGWVACGSAEHEGLEVLPTSNARWSERGIAASWRSRLARRR